jgi:acetyl-CoA carboxylase biotin carboxyl carrier protein
MRDNEIKKLAALMEELKLSKLSIKEKDYAIELEREGFFTKIPLVSENIPKNSLKEEVSSAHFVTSPMVGTFYSAPSPDKPSFVKVGDVVSKGSIICIIEAMKVMNEIKSTVSGVVEAILIDNGHPVEYGTKLYRVK